MLAYPGYWQPTEFGDDHTFELDGVLYRAVTTAVDGREVLDEIRPGDTYWARRNGGARILTAHRIDNQLGCIHPEENAYSYDLHECLKVVVVREASEEDRTAFTGPSAAELKAVLAQPFNYNDLESRRSRDMVFRNWSEHRDHRLVVTESMELEDGSWLLEGYDFGVVEVVYHPEHRTGSFTWTGKAYVPRTAAAA